MNKTKQKPVNVSTCSTHACMITEGVIPVYQAYESKAPFSACMGVHKLLLIQG